MCRQKVMICREHLLHTCTKRRKLPYQAHNRGTRAGYRFLSVSSENIHAGRSFFKRSYNFLSAILGAYFPPETGNKQHVRM